MATGGRDSSGGRGSVSPWQPDRGEPWTPSVFQFVERIAGLAYSEPEAEDAWRRILVFFGEHLR